MKIITQRLTANELKEMAANRFGDLVKVVVDVERELIAVDAELHSDLEALLEALWRKYFLCFTYAARKDY